MLRRLSFRGGCHPAENKDLTSSSPTVEMPLSGELIVPMQQHTGAPAEVLVKPGDEVRFGQRIGEARGFISAHIHSPASGKVKSVGAFPHPLGGRVESVVIETSDGTDEPGPPDAESWEKLPSEELKEAVREAGIVGMGGAAFPTHVKLSPPRNKPIDTIIANGAECEPYVTCDHRLMVERPADVVGGLRIVMRILGCDRAYIAVESNKPDAIEAMRESSRGDGRIKVLSLPVKYPQGGERQLIYAVTGREVPSKGGLPMDVGCLVQNVGTLAAIYDAVVRGRPLVDRIVTVTGGGVREPRNVRARIGTRLRDIIDFCGGLSERAAKVISGGPMMGVSLASIDVPLVKGMSCLLVLEEDEIPLPQRRPCISCARCVDSCPMRLVPTAIAKFAERGIWERAENYGVMDCIECGVCAYVCPSKIPLVQYFKLAKNEIRAMKSRAKEG